MFLLVLLLVCSYLPNAMEILVRQHPKYSCTFVGYFGTLDISSQQFVHLLLKLLLLLLLCSYLPNTIDINTDEVEYKWLLQVLEDQVCEGNGNEN